MAKLINLAHTPSLDETIEEDVTPVPRPFVFAISERWRRVWEVWTNAVRSAPSMVKSNLWLLIDRFWKHCGGRMAEDHKALKFDPRLDSPYNRAAEEVPMVRQILAFMDRVESSEVGAVRDCEYFLHTGSYAQWAGFKNYWARDFADESRFRATRRVMNGWHHFESLGLRKSDRRGMYICLGECYFRDVEASRYLGVATPLLACYASKHYLASHALSWDIYDRMLTVELLQNSVLTFVRAAHVGVPYQNVSDHRHYRDWGPSPG